MIQDKVFRKDNPGLPKFPQQPGCAFIETGTVMVRCTMRTNDVCPRR